MGVMQKGGRWASTESMQQRILDGAQRAFCARGYSRTTLADIVEASGAAVGSLYHHFGDKEQIFLALANRLQEDIKECIDPNDWARSYLECIWEHRELVILLTGTDTPPSYDAEARIDTLFDGFLRDEPVYVRRMVTALLIASVRMVAECRTKEETEVVIDAALRWLNLVQWVGVPEKKSVIE